MDMSGIANEIVDQIAKPWPKQIGELYNGPVAR